ncbi:nuclear pore complex protein NUP160 [Phoenix dactylifera]|uniref:Nuclear pore complex protein NUP160 n=1 Tax=Phoenix dactylifera TaxID=42345 RepID=A0A8B8J8X6_PHODC|nr:nuclear pore complex protein NUP160 [Phoenix dactylifera]XP_026663659.2 nuclear pore complex protein NUP160 [Phoenix dactylifera]
MAAASRSLAGMEVPIAGSEKVRWIDLIVPSSSSMPSPPQLPSSQPSAPTAFRNAASCHVIPGDPPAYLIWRLHKNLPNVLEVVELFPHKEFPETGLHLVFQDALCPFAFLCKNEIQSGAGNGYLLYALTVSGVAYLFNLRSPLSYISGSTFPQNELVEFNVQTHVQIGNITAVTAAPGCIVIGRQDGSIGCYQLGILDPSAPGFMNELRDDVGIGRLWNLVSRGKVIGAVQDMVISGICGRKLLFVLHLDGILRVWDLVSRMKIISDNVSSSELEGSNPSRLCVGDANHDTNLICLAILHEGILVSDRKMVALHHFGFSAGEKVLLSPEPAMQNIHLEEGKLIDWKLHSSKLWILKDDGSMLYDLSYFDYNVEHTGTYNLQEDFVADQLFQSSEHALDDLIWTNSSIFSSIKDRTAYFISSIFLRRLLQPGVYHSSALRATILEHKKYLSDHEFKSLTVAGLKKEIFTIIEGEGATLNSSSAVYHWKSFCSCFFGHWCQNSMPYGLLLDSSNDVIGLIRKSSISLFRSLEGAEHIIYGSSDEFQNLKCSGMILPDSDIDSETLFEALRCMSHINHQLGRAATAIFYESLVSPIVPSDDIICQLLKILETGYSPSLATSLKSQIGVDATWEKQQMAHKSQRKFAVEMLLSLHSLRTKATNWSGVLNVIEKYLKYLTPHKSTQNFDSKGIYNIISSVLVLTTSQVARAMFESAFDVLLLLGYLVNVCGQVYMMQTDVARIKLKLIPLIQEILMQWLILHFMTITPTTPPTVEDFSSRLSSLNIGNKTDKRSLDGKLGSSDFTLACLLDFPCFSEGEDFLYSKSFPNPSKLIHLVQKFSSLVVWGKTGEEFPFSSKPTLELASLLLCHGQYEAAENLFLIIDAHLSSRKSSQNAQSTDGEWCARLHLLGYCLLVRAKGRLHGTLKEQKISESIRCFFRAASGQGAPQSLQNLSFETGLQYSGEHGSIAVWRLHYYQWAMQIFEQYGVNEGACQFALAALEQVDVVLNLSDGNNDDDLLPEPATTIRGRLWANVFKFTLDMKQYGDAYCAIISNPDEDSKYICLRRFVIVLCELGEAKVLCDGKLPFVGFAEKVEQELVWKAERSDISARPNLYKLLYAFEVHRNNWRKAASYMYRYSVRLKKEATLDGRHLLSSALQERLQALAAAINALQLVDHAYAWIDSQYGDNFTHDQGSPNKKPRNVLTANSASVDGAPQSWGLQYCVDIEMLEKEHVLTSAQYLLALVNDKFKFSGTQALGNLVDVLIQENIYDMAFTIIVKFWKGSGLKRELERAFVAISQKCCPNRAGSSVIGSNVKASNLLLPSSEDDTYADGKLNSSPVIHQFKGNGQWETLEVYLEKYRKLHSRLPVTVAETLLYTDPQIELPLWLVHMFKGGRRAMSWGMTGQEADAATLFRLYVDYGRHAEATNLLLEYLESFASLRPADVVNRKKMSAIWFPYTTIERLWSQLEELQSAGHMVEQCDKLKRLLRGALKSHLKQVEMDSEDALSSAAGEETQNSSS